MAEKNRFSGPYEFIMPSMQGVGLGESVLLYDQPPLPRAVVPLAEDVGPDLLQKHRAHNVATIALEQGEQ